MSVREVYIIRKDLDKFFTLDTETNNWSWTKNLEDADMYIAPELAESIKTQRHLGIDTWVGSIPLSDKDSGKVLSQRKKKSVKKSVKRKTKNCGCM